MKTKHWVYLGLLVGLSVVLTRIGSIRIAIAGVEGVRIGFGGLPIILAGVMFGPTAGALVGAVGDVVGYFVNPLGAYMPHFTLTSALTGAIPAWVLMLLGKEPITKLKLAVSIAIGQLITSVVMVPWFLNMLFGVPFQAIMVPRIIGQIIDIPIYVFVIYVLLQRTAKGLQD